MPGSDRWWSGIVRGAATLLAGGGRLGTGDARSGDDRWHRNNRALRAQRGLHPDSRREVVRTLGAALLGLVLIAAAAVGSAAIAPVVTEQLVVLDEAGSVLNQGSGPAD